MVAEAYCETLLRRGRIWQEARGEKGAREMSQSMVSEITKTTIGIN